MVNAINTVASSGRYTYAAIPAGTLCSSLATTNKNQQPTLEVVTVDSSFLNFLGNSSAFKILKKFLFPLSVSLAILTTAILGIASKGKRTLTKAFVKHLKFLKTQNSQDLPSYKVIEKMPGSMPSIFSMRLGVYLKAGWKSFMNDLFQKSKDKENLLRVYYEAAERAMAKHYNEKHMRSVFNKV